VKQALLPWSLADTSGTGKMMQLMAGHAQESCATSVFDAEPPAGKTVEHMHEHIIAIWLTLLHSVARLYNVKALSRNYSAAINK